MQLKEGELNMEKEKEDQLSGEYSGVDVSVTDHMAQLEVGQEAESQETADPPAEGDTTPCVNSEDTGEGKETEGQSEAVESA